jgi:hypothetical protein
MATREHRVDAFSHDGEPPADGLLELLCEDHIGTYLVPFACRWSTGAWANAETGARIEAKVIGWRARGADRDPVPAPHPAPALKPS